MGKKRKDAIHPFLRGNFAPASPSVPSMVVEEYISHPCPIVQGGSIPPELLGGQYIRNGGNPVYPPDKGRHYHWFDGDGMLHGVLFPRHPGGDAPLYTNRHLATPLLTLTLLFLRSPIPSIALLISPLSSLHRIAAAIAQAFFLLLRARMGVLSVANTAVVWWGQGMGSEASDELARLQAAGRGGASSGNEAAEMEGEKRPKLKRAGTSLVREYKADHRLLATCESGPPLEVRVPELGTVNWDRLADRHGETLAHRRGRWEWFKRFGLARVQEDWMTAHPRVDPVDGSLLFYSTSMFDAPHARYSVIDRKGNHLVWKAGIDIGRAKMMHDFAATRTHTILLNLPLTLAPANLFSLPPVPLIHFDRSLPSEFVLFPRLQPDRVVRFREAEPSLIFHTANSWDETSGREVIAVNMLGCRFKSAKLVYAAGAVDVPVAEEQAGEDDVVRLHYYRFEMPRGSLDEGAGGGLQDMEGRISHSFPLSAIPFEFPSTHPDLGMQDAQYVYGCTMRSGSFDERLGGAAKVDCLVKLDVRALVAAGRERGEGRKSQPVDDRSAREIRAQWRKGSRDRIEIFSLPDGWFAQEPRFVPRQNPQSEDDGYLLSYVYDESNLLPDGTPSDAPGSGSELWVIDALRMGEGMDAVVCRIKLPQRVPYGLHGTYLPPSLTRHQRPLSTPLPKQPLLQDKLALSRVQQVVSLLFDRPTKRDMSRFERFILAVMWPLAVGFLALALVDVGFGAAHSSAWTLGSGDVSGQEWVRGEWVDRVVRKLGEWPWPQVMAGLMAVMTALVRSGACGVGREAKDAREASPPPQVVPE